jgi:hypothetical protein
MEEQQQWEVWSIPNNPGPVARVWATRRYARASRGIYTAAGS